jgi:predicted ATPase
MAISDNERVETLEALIGNKSGEVEYIVYEVGSLGSFRREGGKWIVNTEDTPDQFDEMKIVDLDISKVPELLQKWDSKEKLTEEELSSYALPEESE